MVVVVREWISDDGNLSGFSPPSDGSFRHPVGRYFTPSSGRLIYFNINLTGRTHSVDGDSELFGNIGTNSYSTA
jgi:hypothetical protein